VEDFSSDPRWEGVNNRRPVCIQVTQDFRWRADSNVAQGGEPGEVGGRLQRSAVRAYFAADVTGGKRMLTTEDRLQFEGVISVPYYDGGSNITMGWFNSTAGMGKPPANLIGVHLLDSKYPPGYPNAGAKFEWVVIAAANRLFGALRTGKRKPKSPPDLETELHLPVAPGRHSISFDYQPRSADDAGIIQLRIDGKTQTITLDPAENGGVDLRGVGAEFDHFGFYASSTTDGHYTELYIDDLRYTTVGADAQPYLKTALFDTDPGWIGVNNTFSGQDCRGPASQDFGFARTFHVSKVQADPGEIGGIITRVEPNGSPIYYAQAIEPVALDRRLYASWKMTLTNSGTDSSFALGWFRRETVAHHLEGRKNSLPRNFFGIILGYAGTLGSAYVRPAYSLDDYPDRAAGNSAAGGRAVSEVNWDAFDLTDRSTIPKMLIDTSVRDFELRYHPGASETEDGMVRLIMKDEWGSVISVVTLGVPALHKELIKSMDYFGMMPVRAGGGPMEVYLDDLVNTSGPTAAER
jgi:hypothetical protein